MELQAQHYDKILLVHVEGTVAEPDLVQFAGSVNRLAPAVGCVVLDVHLARIEPPAALTLKRLKAQYEKGRIRFLIVSPDFAGADCKTLADAIHSIATLESARLTEILEHDAELREAKRILAKIDATIGAVLELPSDPVPSDSDLARASAMLERKNRALLELFKSSTSGLQDLQVGPSALAGAERERAGEDRLAGIQERALSAIRTAGGLD